MLNGKRFVSYSMPKMATVAVNGASASKVTAVKPVLILEPTITSKLLIKTPRMAKPKTKIVIDSSSGMKFLKTLN